ncbi:thiolase family protein [Sphingobium phenoxybenzoativorans]|uniref:thiolase family protein n=1 Tax=Sphingobium phenoxybenzoativorans TaxID=1592790 RepID=UPI000872E648|nr:thiolase family protein [Sphingobium phenoxybenzoativorans]
MTFGEKQVAITGIGQSEIARPSSRSALLLTIDAILAAIEDAGLTPADIDGLTTWPGRMDSDPGFGPVGTTDIKEALGLKLNYFAGGKEAPAQFGAAINAIGAIAAGLARHVVVFRTVYEATTRKQTGAGTAFGTARVPDARFQWQLPMGAMSASNWTALYAQRHFHDYGTTREQMAQIPLNCRRNAALNPKAIYRTPLTLDDYMGARMISTPLCLYDCDVPVDGATAIIFSRADAAGDLRHAPIRLEAVGSALHGRDSWDQRADLTSMAAFDAAKMMWSRTDMKPSDIDTAQLYDGFTILTMLWLEALGFCGKGESGAFIEEGTRIALAGELPLNTSGGQLSEGRVHGYGYLHEACLQLRGTAGARQIAKPVNTAVVGTGGGPLASCMLLRND